MEMKTLIETLEDAIYHLLAGERGRMKKVAVLTGSDISRICKIAHGDIRADLSFIAEIEEALGIYTVTEYLQIRKLNKTNETSKIQRLFA